VTQGFVVLAQNTKKIDYVKCAEVLALSIKNVMPNALISIVTNDHTNLALWDEIIPLPYGDLAPDSEWKLINDWQVYDASPYDYTIKLEADIYVPRSIEFWWDVLKQREVVVSTTIRDFKQEVSDCRVYRRFIDDNLLPDCYNAITYFKKGELAKKFFNIVSDVFTNWDQYRAVLKCSSAEEVTTDWAYAIACHILKVENTTMPNFTEMSMVHMKQHVNGLPTSDWTDTLVYEILPHTLRINTCPQKYPFHYQKKNFANKIINGLYDGK